MNLKKELSLKVPGIHRGFFITLEGIDGAGKSTQIELLAQALRQHGLNPLTTREPTAGPWGQKIRHTNPQGKLSAAEELDYFVRDREEDVAHFAPALLAGRPVVADRYIMSNVAYQTARGLSEAKIWRANQAFPQPDLVVILEVPVEMGLKRILASRPGGLEAAFEEQGYLTQVKKVFDCQRGDHIVRLDGLAPPQQITELIVAELMRRNLIFSKPLELVDSHCHLSDPALATDLDAVLVRAQEVGISTIVNIGLGLENSRQVLAQAQSHPQLRPVLGWHPHEADDFTPQKGKELMELAQDPSVVGFGEIGLDFALNHSTCANQLRAFESLLEIAAELKLPVVIHSREAFSETLTLLEKYAHLLTQGGVIHCFNRGWDEAQAYLDLNFYLSLPGCLTYPRTEDLSQAARLIPANRLLVETDAPYLTPVPLRGRTNEPAHMIWTLMHLARLRGTTAQEIAAQTTANTHKLFNLMETNT